MLFGSVTGRVDGHSTLTLCVYNKHALLNVTNSDSGLLLLKTIL